MKAGNPDRSSLQQPMQEIILALTAEVVIKVIQNLHLFLDVKLTVLAIALKRHKGNMVLKGDPQSFLLEQLLIGGTIYRDWGDKENLVIKTKHPDSSNDLQHKG